MEIIQLPNYFIDNQIDDVSEIILHDYHSYAVQNNIKITLNSCLFSFLIKGVKQVSYLSYSEQIEASHFLVLRDSNCLMTEKLSANQHYHSLLFFFDKKAVAEFAKKHHYIKREAHNGYDFLSFPKDPFIQNFIQSLLLLNKNKASEALKKAKLEEFLLYLTEKNGSSIIDFLLDESPKPQDINFTKIVEDNIKHKRPLDELAFLCHMSLSTFKRKFKAHYHSSPSKWFLKKRLEQAEYLLRVKQYNPSEIYLEAGFENLSSFTQAFKKEYNITPKKYQQQEN